MASKVVKVLKVLNFSGAGEGHTLPVRSPVRMLRGSEPNEHHPSPERPPPLPSPCAQGEGDPLRGQWFPACGSRSSNDPIAAGGVNE
jgi:hypothetical protein